MNDHDQSSDLESKQDPDNGLVVAIGASAGGFQEICLIVEQLPTQFAGTLLIATHRQPDKPNTLATILGHLARVEVDEPVDEECMECTTIYVGAPNERVEVEGEEFDVEDDRSRHARIHRIDDLFKSVAESAGKNAVGIILSGMLEDGKEGLRAIHKAGGFCMVQDPGDADFRSMPDNALDAVPIAFVGTTQAISSKLMEISIGRRCRD
ncbi:chemotaxis protein CheB [Planctomycetes bacterium K23_9]|uniref:protein-glutamate methylesterase n=1 Tax=Stieleria marina TaxID=1930275 RepID=A0A517NWS5_9BACT|nr:Chemotaxis response regulator protein-glutamate methylesterase [Planctomycetes bacterium K23_9]